MSIFDNILVEGGPSHYAEYFNDDSLLKMPRNALINLGYIVVGMYWIFRTQSRKSLAPWNSYFQFFAVMAIVYGPIQLLRIVTQSRFWGILDQWFTLPFFILVPIFNLQILQKTPQINLISIFLMMTSITSYLLSAIHLYGFDIALGFHILLAVYTSIQIMSNLPSRAKARALYFFFGGCICCSAFVILKLLDLHLPKYHPIFNVWSGHFFSKIGDIGQIHFVLSFFEEVVLQLKTKKL